MITNYFDIHALADRVKTRRSDLEYKQKDVADIAEISVNYVYHIEQCHIPNPGVESLIRLAHGLSVDPRWLIFGDTQEVTTDEP